MDLGCTMVGSSSTSVPAFVLDSFIAAYTFGEFRARGGSSPLVRFLLGALVMIGPLLFLGCPIRATFRLAGGDLNGVTGLTGLAIGTFIQARGASQMVASWQPTRLFELVMQTTTQTSVKVWILLLLARQIGV